jgi:hypothetical protein
MKTNRILIQRHRLLANCSRTTEQGSPKPGLHSLQSATKIDERGRIARNPEAPRSNAHAVHQDREGNDPPRGSAHREPPLFRELPVQPDAVSRDHDCGMAEQRVPTLQF